MMMIMKVMIILSLNKCLKNNCLRHHSFVGIITSCALLFHNRASFMAGLTGAIASNPVDVIRTRLMNQKNFKREIEGVPEVLHFKYRNSFDCFVKVREELL